MTQLDWMGSIFPSIGRGTSLADKIDIIMTWIERTQQRRALARLDDRLLADIGLSRSQAEQEGCKPGWVE